jgi:tripartite-type tricarboxylate transporter receptor subunit TctC
MKLLLSLPLLSLLLVLLPEAVCAQAYPARPVRVLVGFTPGGGTDILARFLTPRLSEYLGQQFVVENRPGAATNVATEMAAKSAPDGYTLLFTTSALAINASLYKNLQYDALRDLAPVSVLAESPNVLVANQNVAAKDIEELVALARAKPGALNYSTAGAGTSQHLAGELFKLRTKTDIVHIPYKGTAPALAGVMGGEVQFSFANVPAILAHVRSGRLRGLAVAGGRRSQQLPEVPTMKEAGIEGVEVSVWYGLLAPAGTPPEIVAALANASMKAARSPELKPRLLEQGAEPIGGTPEEFAKLLREEIAKYADAVKISGAKPE